MKPSRRNIRNATARAERRAAGKPPLSRYEAKQGRSFAAAMTDTRPRANELPQRGIDNTEPADNG